MIIIPDIHGRTFWKEAVAERKPDETVVFLGDYLDPYAHEWEGAQDPESERPKREDAFDLWGQTWSNFNEIIEYKKSDSKHVILLLGNHDLHYIYIRMDTGSRYDHIHAFEIRKRIEDNKDIFQLAYEETVNGRRFIFSHAGIHRLWINDWFGPVVTNENVVDYLNNAFLVDDPSLPRALDQYSTYRGGYESYGSMVWADLREWWSETPSKSPYGDVQVFGHTQLKKDPINFHDTYYCVDVRRAFRINDNGEVCEMDGTVIKKIEHKETNGNKTEI